MGIKDIFKLIPTPWLVSIALALVLALVSAGGIGWMRGHESGYATAKALGDAELATLRSEHNEAFALALTELGGKISELARRAVTAEQKFNQEKERSRNAEVRHQARIAEITRGSTHTFSTAFVRLWNETTGALAPGDAMPGTFDSAVTLGETGSGEGAGSRLLQTGVSEADILAYMNYYGGRCQRIEAQLVLLIGQVEAAR